MSQLEMTSMSLVAPINDLPIFFCNLQIHIYTNVLGFASFYFYFSILFIYVLFMSDSVCGLT